MQNTFSDSVEPTGQAIWPFVENLTKVYVQPAFSSPPRNMILIPPTEVVMEHLVMLKIDLPFLLKQNCGNFKSYLFILSNVFFIYN